MMGSIDSIETFGLVDGPGIRTVVFFSGCRLRCLFCHNPEMFQRKENNMDADTLVKKILRSKPYFKRNHGGVTFSGGEPLLQVDFLLEVCQKLKAENIHIALDTAGVGIGKYDEILSLVDLVILDIKHTNSLGYKKMTGQKMDEVEKFIEHLNKSGKDVWLRQVVVPGITDQEEYLDSLASYVKKIKNVKRIEFLPFHHLGFEKYEKLGLKNPLKDTPEMDKNICDDLYKKFLEKLT